MRLLAIRTRLNWWLTNQVQEQLSDTHGVLKIDAVRQ